MSFREQPARVSEEEVEEELDDLFYCVSAKNGRDQQQAAIEPAKSQAKWLTDKFRWIGMEEEEERLHTFIGGEQRPVECRDGSSYY